MTQMNKISKQEIKMITISIHHIFEKLENNLT